MIKVENLGVNYGDVQALKGINIEIEKGEMYGLLGPNGAGKSTTIGVLSTTVEPSNGQVSLDGFDVMTNQMHCKKMLGVVPQEISLYDELSGKENLMFWGSLYGISKSVLKTESDRLLDMLGLSDRMNDNVGTYSGGMKRRINIASALMHKPEVLLMDEPTVGIDPQSRNLIYEVIKELHRDGMTIIYTTHYMEEAESMCDRIGIIDHGTILAEGTLDALKIQAGDKDVIKVRVAGDALAVKALGFEDVIIDGDLVSLPTQQASTDLPKIITKISNAGIEIKQVNIAEVDLETIFLNLTGRTLRD